MAKQPLTLKQRIAASEMQTKRLAERQRKLETRQKILLGTRLMQHLQQDPELMDAWLNDLDFWLTRDYDRKAFFEYGLHSAIRGLYGKPTFHYVQNPPAIPWLWPKLRRAAAADLPYPKPKP